MNLRILTLFLFFPTFLRSSPTIPEGKSLENDTRERMMNWSRQLGVTCIHCHNLDNFKDDTKLTFKVANKHFQMVKVLQNEVFNDRDKGNELKVKVDCYMCHRGKDIPAYQEPPNQLTK